MKPNPNIIPHRHKVELSDRIRKCGYSPLLLWFTGLSGSGKSTIASAVEEELFSKGFHTYILDGDNIRSGLNKDLDFSDEARKENIRRIGEVANLFVNASIITLTAFISPFEDERQTVRQLVGTDYFVEVYVECPIEECEKRDVKGLYKKARKGLISSFTGINSPFEAPTNPDIHLRTDQMSLENCVKKVLDYIIPKIEIKNA